MDKNTIYICGHRHPDTDSIVSALAYAHLKRQVGVPAIACRLGAVNDETEYLLHRFKVGQPLLLKDSRAIVSEIEIDEVQTIHMEASAKDAMDIFLKTRKTMAVVDDEDCLIGLITNTNLGLVSMGDTAQTIELLKRTPLRNIVKAINGECIYEPKELRFNGKTSIIPYSQDGLEKYDVQDRLVILGNDPIAEMEAILKGAAILVLVWTDHVDERVIELAREKGCAVLKSGHGSMNTSRYILFAPSVREIMTTDLITFNENEFVTDVGRRMLQTRFRSYPVVDDRGRILGLLARYHILNSRGKRMILVDHNEQSQSVEGIEEAEVVEIIDHHRIGDISTLKPILFRNEVIGSTASIISKLYMENNIEIPKDMAALLLAAIISDTMNLSSPTTTKEDIMISQKLEAISALDRDQFAREIYRATSSFKNKSSLEIINQDIKRFTLSGKAIKVSQVVIYDFEVMENMAEFEIAMEDYVKEENLDLLVVVVTSIIEHGSLLYAAGPMKKAVEEHFSHVDGMIYLPDVVSRKNQIIPQLSTALDKYLGV